MKTRYVGLDFIRIWMAVSVVFVHCYHAKDAFPNGEPPLLGFFLAGGFAVPVFMTMSFFLSQGKFLAGDFKWLGRRMLRLYLPFAFWGVVTFIVNTWMISLKLSVPWEADPSWRSLAIHLIGGTSMSYHLQMWFMATLCYLTPCLFLLLKGFRGRLPVKTLWALAVAAVVMQYTGFNKWLFGMIPEFGIRIPAGRFFEMVPYACIGLLVAACRDSFAQYSLKKRLVFAGLGLGAFVFFKTTVVFVKAPGFSYSGLDRMALAFAALAFFYFLPFERLPDWVSKAGAFVARYAMGVYMTHWLVCKLLEHFVYPSVGVRAYTVSAALLAFAAAWVMSFLIGLIPSKTVRSLVT